MKNRFIVYLFGLFAVLQIMIPLTGVLLQEQVLRSGERYQFRTEPVDPYDPFRGKYVTLNIKNRLERQDGETFERGQTVYAIIEKDKDGFAYVAKLETAKPGHDAYFKTRVSSAYSNSVTFEVPFRRYYLDEKKAPQAEKYYREYNRRGKQDASIAVKIKNGRSALEELYISGLPILDFIRQAGTAESGE